MDSADQPFSASEIVAKPEENDPWISLRRATSARIALGRAGGSLRTAAQLDFRLAHARARDAVWATFNADDLEQTLRAQGISVERLHTCAVDRATYLKRPDLGRRLDHTSRERIRAAAAAGGQADLALLVSDGLSAQAAERHAAQTVLLLIQHLQLLGWSFYPVFVVPFARVKLQDEVGELLGARFTLMLLGERPGLGSPDSLSAYFTYQPRAERTDADRNCVSNIRIEGIPPEEAARKLAHLLAESARRGLSGTALKE